ncbi:hypothetical protein [Butyrivibrio sp. AE3004]|uniref:hypothetical protein n=1 Tax=Butyrivibrio sp. AE3004 TaxID=1506994 RepID=UPI0004940ED9|nr:hypothetical protein [Butyrivibrio sp. AE3004]
MGIFLTILKIAGITLLSVLCFVIFLILLILFVPIRYKAHAVIKETDLEKEAGKLKDNIIADASFSWLLHILSGGISYPESKEFKVKVLFFTVFPPKNKKNDALSDDTAEYDLDDKSENGLSAELLKSPDDEAEIDDLIESDTKNDISLDGSDTSDSIKETKTTDIVDEPEASDSSYGDIGNFASKDESQKDFENKDDEKVDKAGFFELLNKIFTTVVKIIKIPQDVFTKIQYTISRIYAKIDMVKNTLNNDIFKRAFNVSKKQFIRVLKKVIPRKFKAKFVIGMSDPTITADILAAYGVMYPVLLNKVFIVPDFENQVIAGETYIKGKITVFTIVWAAAVLYFNKDVKKTVKRFKKIINS